MRGCRVATDGGGFGKPQASPTILVRQSRSVEGDDTLKDASIRSETVRFSRERQAHPHSTRQSGTVLNLSDLSYGA